MNDTIFYLKSIFGNKIYFLYNEYERNFPLFLKDEFDFLKFQLSGNERKYILTKPKKKFDIKLNTIRKQQNQIEKISGCYPVLVVDELRLSQRNALIQSDFAFVVPNHQIYIPNMMMNLTEKDVVKKEYDSYFSVQAQVLFIYMLLNRVKETNARQLSNQLPLSVATINRALNELVDRELIYTVGNNTRKAYKSIAKKLFWEKGKEFLFNPVSRVYYVKNRPYEFLMSNELALTRLSWSLNYSTMSYYAASNKEIAEMEASNFIDRYNLFDDSFYTIEQFKYDPKILSDSNYIDVISLFAQFKDHKDERIQMALDEIMGDVLNVEDNWD